MLWPSTHGVDWALQEAEAKVRFFAWVTKKSRSSQPLIKAIQDQRIFNGLGNSEAMDVLHEALLHPLAPVSILSNPEPRDRLLKAVIHEMTYYRPTVGVRVDSLPLKTTFQPRGEFKSRFDSHLLLMMS